MGMLFMRKTLRKFDLMIHSPQTRKNKNAFTLIEIMIVVLIIGILLGIAVPNFARAREAARAKSCVANLKAIDGAFQQMVMSYRAPGGIAITNFSIPSLVSNGFLKSLPVCPSNGTYSITNSNASATCSIGGTAGDPLAHVAP